MSNEPKDIQATKSEPNAETENSPSELSDLSYLPSPEPLDGVEFDSSEPLDAVNSDAPTSSGSTPEPHFGASENFGPPI